MGLFSLLRRLVFGPPATDFERTPDRAADEHRSTPRDVFRDSKDQSASDRSADLTEAASPRPRRKVRLSPLQYVSSLVPTSPSVERIEGDIPYRFAHRDPNGQFLDLSRDADPRWLEYYGLPEFTTPEQLANWLQLPLGKVAWLTYRFCENRRPQSAKEAHYHFKWIRKRSGGHRLIEAPKQTLKQVQEKILREILDRVPAHPAVHGFVRGRSILTNAQPHIGKRFLLKMDLENFYPTVRYSRVVSIFRSLGYSREVSLWLARLTTSCAPSSLKVPFGESSSIWRYLPRHLPQGAPTSPALANLSAFPLDVRLDGLAKTYHLRYTRYADDLTFSGDGRAMPALREIILLGEQIIRDERFVVHREKRKVIRESQRQTVTGVVVNKKTNVSRQDYDKLKAILHNCRKHGPASQNRSEVKHFAAHIRGRIAQVTMLNAARGQKLMETFAAIDWSR